MADEDFDVLVDVVRGGRGIDARRASGDDCGIGLEGAVGGVLLIAREVYSRGVVDVFRLVQGEGLLRVQPWRRVFSPGPEKVLQVNSPGWVVLDQDDLVLWARESKFSRNSFEIYLDETRFEKIYSYFRR